MKKLILPLIAIMLCVQMTAGFAAEDAKAASDGRALLESIGVSFNFDEGKSEYVKRGDFIYTAVQLVGMGDADSDYVPYTDVASDSAYYAPVGTALKLGYISSDDMFYPDNEITYAEAFKIAVSVLGRDTWARRAGGYPAGYIAEASRSKLSLDINGAADDKLTETDFYLLLKNLVEANYMTVDYVDSKGNIGYSNSSTILKEYFDIDYIEGIVTADSRTGLYEKSGAVSKGQIKIDDVKYDCTIDAPLGCNVEAYVRDDDVVYLHEYDNEITKIKLDDIVSADKNKVTYYDDNKTRSLSLSVPSAFIINGMADTSAKLADYLGKDGYVLFIDSNSDGKIDTVSTEQVQMLYVGSVTDKKIYDKNGETTIDIDDENEFVIDGESVDNLADYIRKGMLLSVSISPGKSFYRMEICSGSAEGKVTGFSNDEKEIYIDDVRYKYNSYFEKYDLSSVKLGMSIKALLDTEGVVTCKSYASGTDMMYGYLIAAAKDSGLEDGVRVKMFADDGSETVYELADKVKLDSQTVSKHDVYTAVCPGANAVKQLIRYSLNDDGEIKTIDTAASAGGTLLGDEDSDNRLIKFAFPSAGLHDTIYYIPETGIVHPYFCVTAETKIFNIGLADTSCKMRSKTWLSENKQLTVSDMEIYDVTSSGDAGVIIIFNRAAVGAEVSEGSDSGIIYSINPAVNADGDVGYKIVSFRNSQYQDMYIIDKEVIDKIKENGTVSFKSGDYIRFDRDASGNVTSIKRDFEYANGEVKVPFENQLYFTYYYGKIFDASGSIVTIMPENIDGLVSGSGANDPRYTVKLPDEITVYDSEKKIVYAISPDEIITYNQSAGECDKVLVKTKDGNIHDVVIYR